MLEVENWLPVTRPSSTPSPQVLWLVALENTLFSPLQVHWTSTLQSLFTCLLSAWVSSGRWLSPPCFPQSWHDFRGIIQKHNLSSKNFCQSWASTEVHIQTRNEPLWWTCRYIIIWPTYRHDDSSYGNHRRRRCCRNSGAFSSITQQQCLYRKKFVSTACV